MLVGAWLIVLINPTLLMLLDVMRIIFLGEATLEDWLKSLICPLHRIRLHDVCQEQ